MLRGIKSKYEVHHGVRITDAALVSAATLSHRYMTERKLPDKAIDLIDEAASRLRLQQESKPEAIQDLDRDIMRLKIEEVALQKENDRNSMDRLSEIRGKLSVLDEEMRGLTQRWNVEKDRLESAKRTKR
jgi:ATP-dependent Clp protease ATP-binding subunit ClpB